MLRVILVVSAMIVSSPAFASSQRHSLEVRTEANDPGHAASLTSSSVNGTFNLVFIGDSITQGVLLSDPGRQAPPVITTEWLQKRLPSFQFYFVNHGKSGHTTVDTLPSTKSDFPEIEEAATQLQQIHQGRLVFSIMLGTNDSALHGPLGSPVSPENYRANLATMIDRLLEEYPGSIIILNHPLWYSSNTDNGTPYLKKGRKRLEQYFPEIDALIAQYGESSPGQVYLGDVRAFRVFKEEHKVYLVPERGQRGTFYLHPNEKGAEALGQLWGEAIAMVLSH